MFNDYLIHFENYLIERKRSPETVRGYIQNLNMVATYLSKRWNGKVLIDDITPSMLNDYLTMLKNERAYKPGSVNRHIQAIRAFYKWAVIKGYVSSNVSQSLEILKVPDIERKHWDWNEAKKLIEAIPHPIVKLASYTLLYTGLRVKECTSLTLTDVDFEQDEIRVIAGKGNKDRIVPLHPKLKKMLKHYVDHERPTVESNWFFATKKTGKLSPVYINTLLKQTCNLIGASEFITCHNLRHIFASELAKQAISIPELAKILGHSDYRTITAHYVHVGKKQWATSLNVLE